MKGRSTSVNDSFNGLTLVISLVFTLAIMVSRGQSCNCDHVIPANQLTVNGVSLNIQPGDTICLQAGLKPYLYLNNIHGDSVAPVVIINQGGPVIIQNTTYNYGIKVANSSFFRFTGTGFATSEYGIKILQTKAGMNGLSLDEMSTNFEVDHFEICNTGFAGIMCKTDPKCDLSTNAGNFTMYDVHIHHNYIYNTGGEGLYIGHSSYSGYATTCNGQPATLYPHEIKGLRVYNNRVEGTHLDGIQIGCATEDCEVYGNTVVNYGTDGDANHITGIQIGGGTTGKCYNNYIADGKGTGIMVFGTGNNTISNNVIKNAGLNYFPGDPTKKVYGIYIGERATVPGRFFNIINNTIVKVKTEGIRFTNTISSNNKILNNIILSPGSLGSYSNSNQSYINNTAGTSVEKSNNFTEPNMNNIQFRDTLNYNFRLRTTSPAKDMGTDATSLGVMFDCDSILRPYYSTFDIGAYEQHPENIWTGKVSTDWNHPGNWSKADIPAMEDDVVIPAGVVNLPVVNLAGISCNNLTVEPGAMISFSPASHIIIAGNLTIEEGAVLDNSGTIELKGNLSNLNP